MGTKVPGYSSWIAMKWRCKNKKAKYHGAVGVKICKRWLNSFENFIKDMGPKPSPSHSIDRYPNPYGDYKPSNCRWATAKEQRRNQREYDESVRVQKSWDSGKRSRVSKNRIDIVGQKFNRLLVIRYVGLMDGNPKSHWLCRCDCGNSKIAAGKSLKNGSVKSCGCLNSESASARATLRNKLDNPSRYRWG